ncbi:MAG: exodeoxyribonuclease VII large subunit [Planctomycetota bacterium]|nr:exodeoxyribonuclease VII large subunit [Planctomycetota bacterium]MDI6787128.1 exodeoxyribonuclease VII large subunit [Planctomycetota bacterium]
MENKNTLPLFKEDKTDRKVFTVSELTERIKSCLESSIGSVWVSGEVSNLRQPVSVHLYFSLKDEFCQIRCVLFDSTRLLIKFQIENGMKLVISGRVTVYKKSGEYQIIIEAVEPKGIGALAVALEQLKKKLSAEGLFDPSRKKPIPFLPQKIGIITSLSGAVLQDILNIIERRFATSHLVIYPVRVQGEVAKEEIAQAIDDFSTLPYRPDVLILARGGGSIEDLWAFNEEIVARAISRSKIPIISAIGHETDYTIADLVSDKRAPTPSAAAEIVLPLKDDLIKQLSNLHNKLVDSLKYQIKLAKTKLTALQKDSGWQAPLNKIREFYQHLDDLSGRIAVAMKSKIETLSLLLSNKASQLEGLSPLNILSRGYSITKLLKTDKIIKSIKEVQQGEKILTKLRDGQFISVVERQ